MFSLNFIAIINLSLPFPAVISLLVSFSVRDSTSIVLCPTLVTKHVTIWYQFNKCIYNCIFYAHLRLPIFCLFDFVFHEQMKFNIKILS